MSTPIRHAPTDIETATFASLIRVLEQAPIENKLAVFGLIGRTAAESAAIRRQRLVDDCWWLADRCGLIDLLGRATVQDALADAFK
jgi:hypothetical protein